MLIRLTSSPHELQPEVCAFATRCLSMHGALLGEAVLSAALPALLAQPEPSRTESFKQLLSRADHVLVAQPAFAELLKRTLTLGPCGPLACTAACCELVFGLWGDDALEPHAEPLSDVLLLLSCSASKEVQDSWVRALKAAQARDEAAPGKPNRWRAVAAALARAVSCHPLASPLLRPAAAAPRQALLREAHLCV